MLKCTRNTHDCYEAIRLSDPTVDVAWSGHETKVKVYRIAGKFGEDFNLVVW